MGQGIKVVIFGGQGTPNLFSEEVASTTLYESSCSSSAAILLSRCHAAFLEEFTSLGDIQDEVFPGIVVTTFSNPRNLLSPPKHLWDDPILQGTVICLQQLIKYLFSAHSGGKIFGNSDVWETAGFSSGVLAATVVAASKTSQEFIDYGVQAVRLAFWTALRSKLYCKQILGIRWKQYPWSLVVLGLSQQEIQERLKSFHAQVRPWPLPI